LHARLTNLATDSEGAAYNLTRQLEEAKRELRWAKEGRQSAETREKLLKGELASFLAGGTGTGDADSAARVRQLEDLVETYKSELENIARDSRDAEERVARGAGMVKASVLEEAEAVIKRLESGELGDAVSHN
jgi:mitotic spindle assembly checkpoint protein MAD1